MGEHSDAFKFDHAKKWGVDEAVMLHNLTFWLRHNRDRGDKQKRWSLLDIQHLRGLGESVSLLDGNQDNGVEQT